MGQLRPEEGLVLGIGTTYLVELKVGRLDSLSSSRFQFMGYLTLKLTKLVGHW